MPTLSDRAETHPEAKLSILCAGTRDLRAARRPVAERLVESVDWSALASRLRASRLLPLLGERILTVADARAPASFADATREGIELYSEHNTMLELITIQVMDALATGGIQSLVIKGPRLGRAVYGKLGRRASADIDLLVPTEDLLAAVEIAKGLGYNDPERPARPGELPPLHYRLRHRSPDVPMLELHWRVHWYEGDFSRDALLRSSGSGLDRRAEPEDELACLLLFYARDGFVDLRLACDIAAWWDSLGPSLEPAAMDGMIARYPRLERVLLAASHVADATVGVPSGRLLGRDQGLERRIRLATLLANPDARGSAQQQNAETWLIDWLVTPPGGRRECIRRQLMAPSGAAGGQVPLRGRGELATLGHGMRLARRYMFALVGVAYEQRRRRDALAIGLGSGPRDTRIPGCTHNQLGYRAGEARTMTEAEALSHFEQHAVRYVAWTQSSRGFDERLAVFKSLLDRHWPQGGNGSLCLDLGCGSGALGAAAGQRGFDVVGIDGSSEMIALARRAQEQRGSTEVREFRQERLPLSQPTVDEFRGSVVLIIASSVVEYLNTADAEVFFGQCAQLLAPGGRLLMSFPNSGALYWRAQRIRGVKSLLGDRDASVQQQRWNPAQVRVSAARHGLTTGEVTRFALPFQERLGPMVQARPAWLATLFACVLVRPD